MKHEGCVYFRGNYCGNLRTASLLTQSKISESGPRASSRKSENLRRRSCGTAYQQLFGPLLEPVHHVHIKIGKTAAEEKVVRLRIGERERSNSGLAIKENCCAITSVIARVTPNEAIIQVALAEEDDALLVAGRDTPVARMRQQKIHARRLQNLGAVERSAIQEHHHQSSELDGAGVQASRPRVRQPHLLVHDGSPSRNCVRMRPDWVRRSSRRLGTSVRP